MQSDRPQRTRIAAYTVIVRDNSILLARVRADIPPDGGKWTLPGGGIDFGEDPAAAAVRETLEETGYHVRLTKLLGVDARVVEAERERVHSVRIIYAAEVVGGELTFEADGSTDCCQWTGLDAVSDYPLVGLAKRGCELAGRPDDRTLRFC